MNILVAMETKPYQRVWLEEAAPGETFIYKEGKAEREDVQNADIILGNVSPKLISTGDKLKWLQTNSAGVDGYIHGCLPEETVLTNATGAYGLAISEYMVAVWLELLKKLHLYRDVQRTASGATSDRCARRGTRRCWCSASATSVGNLRSVRKRWAQG